MTGHDDLKDVLAKAAPPAPEASARDRAANAAMAAFDASEKKSPTLQGSVSEPRPSVDVRQSGLTGFWRRIMLNTLPSPRTMMLGGTSLAVLTLAVMVSQTVDTRFDPIGALSPEPEPAVLPLGQNADDKAAAPARLQNDSQDARLDGVITGLRDEETTPLAQAPGEATISSQAPVPEDEAESLLAPTKAAPAPLAESRAVRSRTAGAAACSGGAAACAPQGGVAPVAVPLERKALADLATDSFQEQGRDRFEEIEPNQINVTAENPVSTFSIDVDTASYSFMRSALMNGVLPPKDAVRVEELINYFPYGYTGPDTRETPFATHVNLQPTPWNADTQLLRIGIKGYELSNTEKPPANLVFLLDTSGSMNAPNKLPLLINSFKLLVESLSPDDTVSIVVYAGSAGTVLEPTKVSDRNAIFGALDRLRAGGSTAGGEGIRQAYRLAEQSFVKDGINRVLLATDGDFNVGITSPDELKGFVERKRKTGVFLSVLGFGRGNYNDALMQTLAQNGNGNAAYIDTLSEARKTLVEEASSTLFPIAKDVKIQVEFNPATVSNYRLIGYETRLLNREDFNNDKVDAGEIGAGHTVTALYEITPVGSGAAQVDPLRYGQDTARPAPVGTDEEFAFLKIRYKQPDSDTSTLITRPITPADQQTPGTDARFAASVAAFGQLLRGGRYTGDFSFDQVIDLANGAKGDDPFGYRSEFVQLVRLSKSAAALPQQQ